MSNTFMSNTSRRAASLLNAALVVAVVGWNYWTARHGLFGNDVRGMSEAYDTQFTPASYAFSIWGLIFLLQGVHAVHQLRLAFGSKPTRFFDELGPWLLLANALNIVWTVAWLGEWTGTSVVILAAINLCLVMALRRTRMGRSKAPVRVVVLEWLPLGVYAGWVAVAVIANLSAWLAKEGWVPGNSSAWALAMIALAFAYNVFVLFRRNLRDHASVAVWAFVAIAVRQWGNGELVAWGAAAAAVTLTLCIAVHLVRALAPRAVAVAR